MMLYEEHHHHGLMLFKMSDTIKNMESRQLYRLQADGISLLSFMTGE